MSKPNLREAANLTPDDVKAMPLDEFEQRFKFRPVDAFEKLYFAMLARRLNPVVRGFIMQRDPPTQEMLNAVNMKEVPD